MVNNVKDAMCEFDSNTEKNNIQLIRVLESNKTAFQKVVGEDGNIEEIRNDLESWLNNQQSNQNNTSKYCIQFFKDYKKLRNGIDANGAIHCYLQFKPGVNPGYVGNVPMYPGQNNQELVTILKEIQEQNKALQSLLVARLEDDEDDEEDNKDKSLIAGILGDEQIKNLLVGVVGSLANKYLLNGNIVPGAVAGITQDEQMQKAMEAINILSKTDLQFGEHLLYLANLPGHQYKMLLSFIK